jgi:ribose/xylose/arabinose/galactoside ABC-type transport system permease subunit
MKAEVDDIMRPLARKYGAAYWLHKCLVLVAAALLVTLALTLFPRVTSLGGHVVATGTQESARVMGRGGQFEKPPAW